MVAWRRGLSVFPPFPPCHRLLLGQIDEPRGLLSRVHTGCYSWTLGCAGTPSPIAEVGQVPHRARNDIVAWGVTTGCSLQRSPSYYREGLSPTKAWGVTTWLLEQRSPSQQIEGLSSSIRSPCHVKRVEIFSCV